MKRILLSIALLTGCMNWSKRDTALEASFLAITALDWIQTTQITSMCQEANPIIGPCGKNLDPGVYFPIIMFGEYVLSNYIPESQRPWLLGLGIGTEAHTVYHNHLDGIDP